MDNKIDFVFIGGWRLTATVGEDENFKVEVSNEQGEAILTDEGKYFGEWYFNLKKDENEEI
jgi:hypothetical protein